MQFTKEERDRIFECSGARHEIYVFAMYTDNTIELHYDTCKNKLDIAGEILEESSIIAKES